MGLEFEWDIKKAKISNTKLEEYDFSKGIRGKYAKEYREGVNILKLDSDVMKFFPDTKSVNEALRTLINLMNNNQSSIKFS